MTGIIPRNSRPTIISVESQELGNSGSSLLVAVLCPCKLADPFSCNKVTVGNINKGRELPYVFE